MHVGSRLVTLGAPETLTEWDGLSRMPSPVRQMLPVSAVMTSSRCPFSASGRGVERPQLPERITP